MFGAFDFTAECLGAAGWRMGLVWVPGWMWAAISCKDRWFCSNLNSITSDIAGWWWQLCNHESKQQMLTQSSRSFHLSCSLDYADDSDVGNSKLVDVFQGGTDSMAGDMGHVGLVEVQNFKKECLGCLILMHGWVLMRNADAWRLWASNDGQRMENHADSDCEGVCVYIKMYVYRYM